MMRNIIKKILFEDFDWIKDIPKTIKPRIWDGSNNGRPNSKQIYVFQDDSGIIRELKVGGTMSCHVGRNHKYYEGWTRLYDASVTQQQIDNMNADPEYPDPTEGLFEVEMTRGEYNNYIRDNRLSIRVDGVMESQDFDWIRDIEPTMHRFFDINVCYTSMYDEDSGEDECVEGGSYFIKIPVDVVPKIWDYEVGDYYMAGPGDEGYDVIMWSRINNVIYDDDIDMFEYVLEISQDEYCRAWGKYQEGDKILCGEHLTESTDFEWINNEMEREPTDLEKMKYYIEYETDFELYESSEYHGEWDFREKLGYDRPPTIKGSGTKQIYFNDSGMIQAENGDGEHETEIIDWRGLVNSIRKYQGTPEDAEYVINMYADIYEVLAEHFPQHFQFYDDRDLQLKESNDFDWIRDTKISLEPNTTYYFEPPAQLGELEEFHDKFVVLTNKGYDTLGSIINNIRRGEYGDNNPNEGNDILYIQTDRRGNWSGWQNSYINYNENYLDADHYDDDTYDLNSLESIKRFLGPRETNKYVDARTLLNKGVVKESDDLEWVKGNPWQEITYFIYSDDDSSGVMTKDQFYDGANSWMFTGEPYIVKEFTIRYEHGKPLIDIHNTVTKIYDTLLDNNMDLDSLKHHVDDNGVVYI